MEGFTDEVVLEEGLNVAMEPALWEIENAKGFLGGILLWHVRNGSFRAEAVAHGRY